MASHSRGSRKVSACRDGILAKHSVLEAKGRAVVEIYAKYRRDSMK